ncbi:MAG: sugar phosphate nucleotidyltransferase [Bacteroidota bacterium]
MALHLVNPLNILSPTKGETMKAMILAAGLGTRLKPFTDRHPKALAVVNGKTVLQRNIEWLQQYGITEVIVNVHHFADQIINLISASNGWGSNVVISDETNEVLETGGGIKKAGWFLQQDAISVVMNADILTDLRLDKMIFQHQQKRPLATLATANRQSSRYLLFEEDTVNGDLLKGWKNTKTHELKGMDAMPKAFSGIQVLSSEIFELITAIGKFSMIDVYLDLCRKHPILSFDHSESKLIDIGTMDKLALAETLFK